jgi:hypothetical protein
MRQEHTRDYEAARLTFLINLGVLAVCVQQHCNACHELMKNVRLFISWRQRELSYRNR